MANEPETSSLSDDKACVICRLPINFDERCSWSNVSQAGQQSLLVFSTLRSDLELTSFLQESPSSVRVHDKCRKHYTSQRRFNQEKRASTSKEDDPACTKRLRSAVDVAFQWKEHCMLCGDSARFDSKHPKNKKISRVETLTIRSTLLNYCSERSDAWGLEVQSRINTCNDLVAVEAVYHRACYAAFSGKRSKVPKSIARGGKVCGQKLETFETLCAWIELCDDELYTVCDLHEKMLLLAGGDEELVYSKQQLQRKLEEKYGEHIFFAKRAGKNNVVCFRDMAACVINEQWYKQKELKLEDESLRVVIASAKLIKAQIREMFCDMSTYPVPSDLSDVESSRHFLPPLLDAFMKYIVFDDLKQVALSHCLIHAARPRSIIAPILLGLGVSLDHTFGSEWLLSTLARLGLCVSYDEVTRYKQSVMQNEIVDLPQAFPDSFTQFSGDNVDHESVSLDGLGAPHWMGMISMSTPVSTLSNGKFGLIPVTRTRRSTVDCLIRSKGVPVLTYSPPECTALSTFELTPLHELASMVPVCTSTLYRNLDLLWHSGFFFQDEVGVRPAWSGYMQNVTASCDDFHPVSDIRMLPIIALNPNDMSCLLSTLTFLEKQAHVLNMETACITFDQPLYIKAFEIANSAKLKVVCRLGGFHLLMNFLGAIGNIMAGSGLSEALETCYGPVTVTHMMTGKAYSKAMRGHLMVESTLMILIMEKILDQIGDPDKEGFPILDETDVHSLKVLYSNVIHHCSKLVDEESIPIFLCHLQQSITAYKVKLSTNDRTAALWSQYMYYMSIVKDFITAERTSNWKLHLQTVFKMLNLLAATGHNNYAKCARLYVQEMTNLSTSNPWLHKQLSSGRHSVRRSDRHWAAISTDLAIEQVMMGHIHSRAGLTHGRGFTESVRQTWIETMHYCATMHGAITSLTNLEHCASDSQHVELGQPRLARDKKDLSKLLDWFRANSPFQCSDHRLHSLSTGLVVREDDHVNCDTAEAVGAKIQSQMDGMKFNSVVMKKINRATTLSSLSGKLISVPGSSKLPVHSSVLFSRLLVIMQREPDISGLFQYELTAVPTALFKGEAFRKTDKSQLAKVLTANVVSCDASRGTATVVDGGWLLHKVKWQPGVSYIDIAHQYTSFVARHFGSSAIIVFDGYEMGPSIKDHEHSRRATKSSPDVVFDSKMIAYRNQGAFLSNTRNKAQFVLYLIESFLGEGYVVHQAQDDADTLIVDKAIQCAQSDYVTVVANDTDILVLLVCHFESAMKDIFLHYDMSTRRASSKNVLSIRDICNAIGHTAVRQLLVVHALSGCDTTSCLYGYSKTSIWKRVTGNEKTLELTDVIECSDCRESIVNAGLQLMSFIYGGKFTDSMNTLRYTRYLDFTASATAPLKPERLPPTINAIKFHILRTHLQVRQWRSLMKADITPTDWGWKLMNGQYIPIATDLEPAPERMLAIMRCKCRSDSKHPCSTQLCTCAKNGLQCVVACKHCKGCDCENASLASSSFDFMEHDTEDEPVVQVDVFADDDCLEFAIPWIVEEEV